MKLDQKTEWKSAQNMTEEQLLLLWCSGIHHLEFMWYVYFHYTKYKKIMFLKIIAKNEGSMHWLLREPSINVVYDCHPPIPLYPVPLYQLPINNSIYHSKPLNCTKAKSTEKRSKKKVSIFSWFYLQVLKHWCSPINLCIVYCIWHLLILNLDFWGIEMKFQDNFKKASAGLICALARRP